MRLTYLAAFSQALPLVNGCAGSPLKEASRPSRTLASRPQVLGLSRVQVVTIVVSFMVLSGWKCASAAR